MIYNMTVQGTIFYLPPGKWSSYNLWSYVEVCKILFTDISGCWV